MLVVRPVLVLYSFRTAVKAAAARVPAFFTAINNQSTCELYTCAALSFVVCYPCVVCYVLLHAFCLLVCATIAILNVFTYV